ncbi:TetR/AcrR family transcriptional regulator [Leifsonia aquatica]|uniref:Transcriptional regulator, TetR family n=2 Tax=Leifsonia aquatica TaxID=144185 RepID=U2RP13_LEIAQ|nr:TetR family transcriptional regulator [Leifsonia aquatica]ERK70324.1 transcriptional regulator, TetR family [Leifsonia aquatica ATCC 14665]MBB2967141.1 AcrR family transcriptional regulator [Leifsonia aquatica]
MPRTLSTADDRREAVLASAITVFARTGYLGTPIAAVASDADISPAYVFKLFPGKESLFVAALDRCFELIEDALERGARTAADGTPDEILDAMGLAYAELISDRSLLMLQVHAQSAADVPEIHDALRRGLARVTRFAATRSGADGAAIQHFIAWGQLCHLTVTLGLDDLPDEWARTLTRGIRHP